MSVLHKNLIFSKFLYIPLWRFSLICLTWYLLSIVIIKILPFADCEKFSCGIFFKFAISSWVLLSISFSERLIEAICDIKFSFQSCASIFSIVVFSIFTFSLYVVFEVCFVNVSIDLWLNSCLFFISWLSSKGVFLIYPLMFSLVFSITLSFILSFVFSFMPWLSSSFFSSFLKIKSFWFFSFKIKSFC
jgi:hypothetical protein